jgi:omega-amidase
LPAWEAIKKSKVKSKAGFENREDVGILPLFCSMSNLSFTLIQSALHWEDKHQNLSMFEKKIRNMDNSSHVIVLPEMFSTGFSMAPQKLAENMEGSTMQWLKKMAAEKRVIITGSFIAEEGGEYFNRLIWMLPNGEFGQYDKRHLFAFAGEHDKYKGGNKRLVARVNGWKINLQVCYDLRFPVWARQQFDEQHEFEYDVLLYVANWPERRNTAWKSLLQARAIENQCYVIGLNRVGKDGNDINHSGNSMVIDPLGEILYHKEHEEDIFTVHLDKDHLEEVRRKFQFWRDADKFRIEL